MDFVRLLVSEDLLRKDIHGCFTTNSTKYKMRYHKVNLESIRICMCKYRLL